MSIATTLGGYLVDADGVRHQLPLVQNPSDSITENVIKKVSCAGRGIVVLACKPAPKNGPEKLELYVDAGTLLLMLGVNEEDGDYSVRTLRNEGMSNDLVDVMGEQYPSRALIHDIDFACSAFNEFARIGDVPSMR